MHLFAPEVGILGTVPLVAATIPLAVGSALASKLRGDGRVSVAFFGDGAVEEGHAHESMNLAAVYKLPIVFVCENNFYASHMALLERRAEDNVARAGALHGMPAACLDGNDVVTVWRESVKAVDRARRGEGPTLLECRTYRWRGHVGPSYDMDVGVRRKDELGEWRTRDPLPRAREALVSRGMAASRLADLERRVDVEIDDAVAAAQCAPYPAVTELLDHVYAPGGATL